MKKSIIWMTVIAVLCLGQAAWAIDLDGTKKIGHRGARAISDENTMESLRLAVELGVDMLEFDIQRTSDDVFVLMHDVTVDRTTDGSGKVRDMTLEEFKELTTDMGYTPPALEEVLAWLQMNSVVFILDFKITDPDEARDLIELVERYGLLERAVFESPSPKVAGMVEDIRPDVVTAVYPVNMFAMRYYLYKYDIDIASYNYLFANPLEIALVRHMDKSVIVWTVNSRGMIDWFERLEVDGIMTDDPNLFD